MSHDAEFDWIAYLLVHIISELTWCNIGITIPYMKYKTFFFKFSSN